MLLRRTPLVLFALLIAGCPQPADDDDATPVDHGDPPVVLADWTGNLGGTISYLKQYEDEGMEDCTETFTVIGNKLSEVPQECTACDTIYLAFVTEDATSDCRGDHDLIEDGRIGLDLRETTGEAVLWFFFQGWFSSDWYELGTGSLSADHEADLLHFEMAWDDPDNGSSFGNSYWGEGCFPCSWNGFYTFDLTVDFEVPDAWWDLPEFAE